MSDQLYDKNGVPIYPGDLLKSYHFTGARHKRYWLYHVAVERDGYLWAVPASHLEPTKANGGGTCLAKYMADKAEVIQGYGPGDYLCFDERPRRKQPKKGGE